MIQHSVDYIKKHRGLLLVLIPAFIFHMIIIMPSGSYYCLNNNCGLYFWGPHDHDAIWHLALSAVSFDSYPFIAPTYAGEVLAGYNLLLDLILFVLSKLGVPAIISYFKLIPITWFILISLVTVFFARQLNKSSIFVGSFLFFLFFGGSFGYFFTLYYNRTIFDSSSLLAIQAGHMLINLQFAISLIILFCILILLKKRNFTFKNTLFLSLLVFLNVGFKFYGGVISIFFASIYFLEFLIRKKNIKEFLKHIGIFTIIVLAGVMVFYNPLASTKSGSIFTVAPFAIVHSMIEERSLFYLEDMVNARYFLQEQGWGLRLLWIELLTSFLYIFFNLGTRIIGIIYFMVQLIRRRITRFEMYIFSGIVFSTCLSLLLIQKGVWWNTVQFFYYAIVLSNIFAAQALYEIIRRKKTAVLGIFIFLLTVPVNIDLLRIFTTPGAQYISKEELEALHYLKEQPKGVVFHSFEEKPQSEYPFHSYEDTSYIPAFTGKQSYLANFHVLDLIGVNYLKRLERIQSNDCKALTEVDYIYYVKKQNGSILVNCKDSLRSDYNNTFTNDEVEIFQKL